MVTLASFKYAFRGLRAVINGERNAKVHIFFAIVAVLLSLLLHVGRIAFLFVIFAIFMVFFAEIINTAIEKTLDLISQENNHLVQLIKDMTAAGVLVMAFGAILVGLVVFVPPIWGLVTSGFHLWANSCW